MMSLSGGHFNLFNNMTIKLFPTLTLIWQLAGCTAKPEEN